MKNKKLNIYYLLSCIGVLIASYYPLSMGVRVVVDMITEGTVLKENYPKYIIPYTPISLAIIIGTILMPVCMELFKKFALVGGVTISAGVFLATELLFEYKIVVETVTTLKDWQMFMCYIPSDYKTQTTVEILMGDYSPAFKLHFYLISVVLILGILNCLYGFGQIIRNGEKKRLKSLILQSICTAIFLGLCILACFTAFWRDGNISVSALSAVLMSVFFILLGVTVGIFVGSLLIGKRKLISVFIPSIISAVITLVMYIGEMCLLSGNLYKYGSGFFFRSLPGIVLAPVDILIIIAAGCITATIFYLIQRQKPIET